MSVVSRTAARDALKCGLENQAICDEMIREMNK